MRADPLSCLVCVIRRVCSHAHPNGLSLTPEESPRSAQGADRRHQPPSLQPPEPSYLLEGLGHPGPPLAVGTRFGVNSKR